MHTGFRPGAQRFFWHKLSKLDTLHQCDGEFSFKFNWNEFVSNVGQVLGWNFLEFHFCWNARNCIPKLHFYFIVLVNMVAVINEMTYLHLWVMFWVEFFSRFAPSLKRLQYGILKLVWSRMDWIWGFCVGKSLMSSSFELQGPNIERFAYVWCFDKAKFFRFLVCGVHWAALKCA